MLPSSISGGVISLLLSSLVFLYVTSWLLRPRPSAVKAPYVGYRSKWEPTWLLRLRFVLGSQEIIGEGYKKYKDSMFMVRRNDKDILIISQKNVENLRNLPVERLSAMEAHISNLLGHWSTTQLMLESDLPTRTLQQKLTPRLGSLMTRLKYELDFALKVEIPDCRDWRNVDLYNTVLHLLSRLSARLFVGPVICRNEEWLETSRQYTQNVFMTVVILRLLPPFLHTVVAPVLPSYWRMHRNIATAHRLIGSEVRQRNSRRGNDDDKPDNFLQWMMEGARGNEGHPDKLAQLQLILSLAAMHTTNITAVHALYDLIARPEYLEPLRNEILSVLEEEGGKWQKSTVDKLWKLDSFIKESQRFSPPSQLAFNRVVKQSPLKLYDGTVLPVGTHFNIASHAILHDPEILPGGDPDRFDGFRYATLRQNSDVTNKYQLAATDNDNLHFGHGRHACPGRFMASTEMKLVLAHLILLFDFKYLPGKGRPRNFTGDENVFPDPRARVLMRRREGVTSLNLASDAP